MTTDVSQQLAGNSSLTASNRVREQVKYQLAKQPQQLKAVVCSQKQMQMQENRLSQDALQQNDLKLVQQATIASPRPDS